MMMTSKMKTKSKKEDHQKSRQQNNFENLKLEDDPKNIDNLKNSTDLTSEVDLEGIGHWTY